MKELNKKIINKVYSFEAKRTLEQIFLRLFLGLFFLLSLLFFGSIIRSILIQQESFDLLLILSQDMEVVRKFLIDDLFIFFNELPKTLLLFFLAALILLFLLIWSMIKNYKKNSNKLRSIISFWKKKI